MTDLHHDQLTVAEARARFAELPDDAVITELSYSVDEPPCPVPPSELTREDLIALCTDGVVPHDRWRNRDTSSAQRQLGEACALLAAGCEYFIEREIQLSAYWVHITFRGFGSFEYGDEAPLEEERFYIPTRLSLDNAAGGDWY